MIFKKSSVSWISFIFNDAFKIVCNLAKQPTKSVPQLSSTILTKFEEKEKKLQIFISAIFWITEQGMWFYLLQISVNRPQQSN